MEMEVEVPHANPYWPIIIEQNQNDADVLCDVCLEESYEDDNEIIICDLCLGACHLACHGGDLYNGMPKGDWFCERCRVLLSNP